MVLNTEMCVRKEWNTVFHLTLWERNICEKEMCVSVKKFCNF
jgi:hypothetical protein